MYGETDKNKARIKVKKRVDVGEEKAMSSIRRWNGSRPDHTEKYLILEGSKTYLKLGSGYCLYYYIIIINQNENQNATMA